MKAISLWQPWASLWVSGRKIHETRHWSTNHRGWLLVHAAKRFEKTVGEHLEDILIDEFGGHWSIDLPTGALIGAIKLDDCIPSERIYPNGSLLDDYWCGDFSKGRFGWFATECKVFASPIPYKGMQGMFSVPTEIVTTQLNTNQDR